jgi:anti-sigma factor RsiW
MSPPAIIDRLLRRDVDCRRLVELVTGYLEGTLPAGEARRVEAHLAGCPHCVAYVEQMRATLRVTGAVSLDVLSPQAEQELLAAFADWQASGA